VIRHRDDDVALLMARVDDRGERRRLGELLDGIWSMMAREGAVVR
jgi:hypothetical protein